MQTLPMLSNRLLFVPKLLMDSSDLVLQIDILHHFKARLVTLL